MALFIAGVHKSGTTSLHAHLCRHPMICGGLRKELHLFDDPARDWDRPDPAAFRALFPDHQPGQWRLDASPSYLYLPECLARIRAQEPGARLILLCRDPVERAWSHWSARRRNGFEPLDFDAAIRAEEARIAASTGGPLAWKGIAYVDRGRYGRQLRHALSLFPRAQLLILDSADLARDPDAVLARVSAFLGLAPFAPAPVLQLNRGPGEALRLLPETHRYIAAKLGADIRDFGALSGLEVGTWPVLNPPPPDAIRG